MIYVDINCFNVGKTYDLRVDENISVYEILKELALYLDFDCESAWIISTFRKEVLVSNLTLLEQGVLGGDLLILIYKE